MRSSRPAHRFCALATVSGTGGATANTRSRSSRRSASNPKTARSLPAHRCGDPLVLLQELLTFYGPLTAAELETLLPAAALALLPDCEYLLEGELISDETGPHLCDPDNFEILLRFQRRANRPSVETAAGDALARVRCALAGCGQPRPGGRVHPSCAATRHR